MNVSDACTSTDVTNNKLMPPNQVKSVNFKKGYKNKQAVATEANINQMKAKVVENLNHGDIPKGKDLASVEAETWRSQ